VVVKSTHPDHCAGNYPFQCCCICAREAGWKGWQENACSQCKGIEAAQACAVADEDGEEGMGAIGFVNRRGASRNALNPEHHIFTFQSLRKRTSFMKAKAAAMHAKGGVIAVDNGLDECDRASHGAAATCTLRPAASRATEPLYDAQLMVLREGWLLKQSKTLKMWQKKYFVLDSVALYWAKSPHDVPDGFYPIRNCQFLQQAESGTFELITSGGQIRMQVLRYKTEEGQQDLLKWTSCYTRAMNDVSFPYFHVRQTCRRDMSMELLLGACKEGLRLVKLGLYDPCREEEIAFFNFSEIYEWGCPDIDTFEFCATSEREGYVLKTMHASDIEQMVLAKFKRWKEDRKNKRSIS